MKARTKVQKAWTNAKNTRASAKMEKGRRRRYVGVF